MRETTIGTLLVPGGVGHDVIYSIESVAAQWKAIAESGQPIEVDELTAELIVRVASMLTAWDRLQTYVREMEGDT